MSLLMNIYGNTLSNIANAIRWRSGSDMDYYPSQMPNAIDNIRVNRLAYMFGVLNNNQFCGDYVTSMENAFRNHSLSGNAVCGNAVWMFSNAFAYSGVSGAVCGPSVSNMQDSYRGCTSLRGNAAAVEGVVDMRSAYEGCTSLENPICPNTVINFASCYRGCSAMTGEPVCGTMVNNMYKTYEQCTSLGNGTTDEPGIGLAVIGPNVENVQEAYNGCRGIKTAVIGGRTLDYYATYKGCSSLENIPEYIQLDNAVSTFENCKNLKYASYIEANNARRMFAGCSNLKTIIGGYVQNGSQMFIDCNNLNTESFITAYDMREMYRNAGRIADDIGIDISVFENVRYMSGCWGIDSRSASGRFYFEGLERYDGIKYPDILHEMDDASGAFAECWKLYLSDSSKYRSGTLPNVIPIGRNTTRIDQMYRNTPVYGNFYIYSDLVGFANCFGGRIAPAGLEQVQRLNIICKDFNTFCNIRDEQYSIDNSNNKSPMRIMGTHIEWIVAESFNKHLYNNEYNVHLYFDPEE